MLRPAVLLSALLAAPVALAEVPASVEGDFTVRDFRFASGETLPELRLHYTTLGQPRKDAQGVVRNAVLVLHGTGGTGRAFLSETFGGVLFAKGGLLDAEKYFIVLPDGIGHGKSSKPSDGLRARFPHYGYRDMVAAHHRLLTEGLGVNHLRLVIGTSMGAMHTWLWGERYPDFMDALMPLASLPIQISGRNRTLRRMVIDPIRNDPDWKNGDYVAQPVRGLTSAIYTLLFMTSSPLQWQKKAPTRETADAFFDEMLAARLKTADANDMLYQFDSSRDYDPGPELEKIQAPLVAINSADDQVNPPELGILEREIVRVKRGRAVVLPITDQTRGHGTHSVPAIWKGELERLLRESERVFPSTSARLNPLVDLLERKQPIFGLYAPSNRRPGPPGAVAPWPEPTKKTPLELAQAALAYSSADFIFDGSMEGGLERGLPAFSDFAKSMSEAGALSRSPALRFTHPLVVKTPKLAPDFAKANDNISRQLNLGVSGVVFVEAESAEEVERGLRALRFQSKGGTRPDEIGGAPAFWGMSEKDYREKADLWPLNPAGELVNWTIVESKAGLKHVREIAAVKGIGVLFPGAGTLRGVFSTTNAAGQRVLDGEAWEGAIQQVLAACKEFDVPCGYPADANDIELRMKQGFSVFVIGWGEPGFKTVAIGRGIAGRGETNP